MGNLLLFVVIAVAFTLVFVFVHNLKAARRRVQELKFYARRREPIIEHSRFPGDEEVQARAERHRQLLTEAGNQWDVQVFVFEYQDVRNKEANGLTGMYEDYYRDYLPQLGEFAATVFSRQASEVRKLDGNAYRQYIQRQQ